MQPPCTPVTPTPKFRPIAHATHDGRVAVYVGAATQYLRIAEAAVLFRQLGTAIELAQIRATEIHAAATKEANP